MRRTPCSLISMLLLVVATPAWAQDTSPFDGFWVLDISAAWAGLPEAGLARVVLGVGTAPGP